MRLSFMPAAAYDGPHLADRVHGGHVGSTACLWLVPNGAEELRARVRSNPLDGHLVRMFASNRIGASQQPLTQRYLVAIASVVAAMIVVWLVGKPWHAPLTLALFLVAVIISGWFGGTKPSALAIALSVVALDYFLFPTPGSA